MGWRNIFEGKEIKELRAEAESNHDDPSAHFNLGAAYVKAGRTKEAIREFEETLKGNPRSAEAHYNLALLYEGMNSGDKAVLHMLKAGNLFSNKNDQVNKVEARGLLRQYYRKFNIKPDDFSQNDLVM
jgi:tetratricopeptide (TPR) repeat protein